MAIIDKEGTRAKLENDIAVAEKTAKKAASNMVKYRKDWDRYYKEEARRNQAIQEVSNLKIQLRKYQQRINQQKTNQPRSEQSSVSNNRYPNTKSESSNKLEKLQTDLEKVNEDLSQAKIEVEKAEKNKTKHLKDEVHQEQAQTRYIRAIEKYQQLFKESQVLDSAITRLENKSPEQSQKQPISPEQSQKQPVSTQQKKEKLLKNLEKKLEDLEKNIQASNTEVKVAENKKNKHLKNELYQEKVGNEYSKKVNQHNNLLRQKSALKKRIANVKNDLAELDRKETIDKTIGPGEAKVVQTEPAAEKKESVRTEKVREEEAKAVRTEPVAEKKERVGTEKVREEETKAVRTEPAAEKNESVRTEKVREEETKAVRTEPVAEKKAREEVANPSEKRTSISLIDGKFDGRSTKEYKKEPIVIPPKEELNQRETLAQIRTGSADKQIENTADSSEKRPSITLADGKFDGQSTDEYEIKSETDVLKDPSNRRKTLSQIGDNLAGKKRSGVVKPEGYQSIETKENNLLEKLTINEDKLAKYTTRGKTLWGKVKNFFDRGKISELKAEIHTNKQELITMRRIFGEKGEQLNNKVEQSRKISRQISKENDSKENRVLPKVNTGKSI